MQRVALYGTTLVISTTGASLQGCADVELIYVDPAVPGLPDRLRALEPAAVIFDLTAGQPDFAIPLLRERPGMVLIGVDPASDSLLVLSGHAAKALTEADLLAVIAQGDSHSEA